MYNGHLFLFIAGTQRVISFLRQMVEHGGFYRTVDQTWVKFERIQFVGACNPPTDPGRKPLSYRCFTSITFLVSIFYTIKYVKKKKIAVA